MRHARQGQGAATRLVRPACARAARRVRLGLVALGLAVAFSVATYSSPSDDQQLLRDALRRGADRLVAMQLPDGSWPGQIGSTDGDLARSGRLGRALLSAHAVLQDDRHLEAASRCADALAAQVERSPRIASVSNLLFLAQFGRTMNRPELVDVVRSVRTKQLVLRGTSNPLDAARELVSRPNRTVWTDGAWRNYLLWHAGEHAELARTVGATEWAEQFVVTVGESWAPKHDFAWWALGSGRLLRELSRVPGERARRLAAVHLESLRESELLPGLPWNETPYDTFVFAQESAAVLDGMIASRDPEARRRALVGLRVVALRQAPHGGWGAELALADAPPVPGAFAVPPAELAVRETLEVDAEIVSAIAHGLRTAPSLPLATRELRMAALR